MRASDQLQSPPNPDDRSRPSGWVVVVGMLLGVGVGLLIGVLFFGGRAEDPPPAPLPATTLQRIVDDPKGFFGDNTVVSGQVREIISPRAFTVGQAGLLGPELLVVTKEPLAAPTTRSGTRPLLEGDPVHVAGQVREFDLPAFERDFGVELRREFDSFLGDDLGERRGDPAVRADSVVFTPRSIPVAEAREAEEIVERPHDFYGKFVSVTGRVTDLLPSGALILDGRLVALTADFGQRRPREGETLRVLGPVRPVDPDQLRAGRPRVPDDEIFGRFANRPAVVAQSIEVER